MFHPKLADTLCFSHVRLGFEGLFGSLSFSLPQSFLAIMPHSLELGKMIHLQQPNQREKSDSFNTLQSRSSWNPKTTMISNNEHDMIEPRLAFLTCFLEHYIIKDQRQHIFPSFWCVQHCNQQVETSLSPRQPPKHLQQIMYICPLLFCLCFHLSHQLLLHSRNIHQASKQ